MYDLHKTALPEGYHWVTINGEHIPVRGNGQEEGGGDNSPSQIAALRQLRTQSSSGYGEFEQEVKTKPWPSHIPKPIVENLSPANLTSDQIGSIEGKVRDFNAKAIEGTLNKKVTEILSEDRDFLAFCDAYLTGPRSRALPDATKARVVVDQLSSNWQASSSHPTSLLIQEEIPHCLPISSADVYNRQHVTSLHEPGTWGGTAIPVTEEMRVGIRKYVQATYYQQQKMLEDAGIDSVVAYRGMTYYESTARPLHFETYGEVKPASLKLAQLNSYSIDADIAGFFTIHSAGYAGEIMATVVPRQRIFNWIGGGEAEIVVLGGGRQEHLTSTKPEGEGMTDFGGHIYRLREHLAAQGKMEKRELADGYRWVTINGMHVPVKSNGFEEGGGGNSSAQRAALGNIRTGTTYEQFSERVKPPSRELPEHDLSKFPLSDKNINTNALLTTNSKVQRLFEEGDDSAVLHKVAQTLEKEPEFVSFAKDLVGRRELSLNPHLTDSDVVAMAVNHINVAWEGSSSSPASLVVGEEIAKLHPELAGTMNRRPTAGEITLDMYSGADELPVTDKVRSAIRRYAQETYKETQAELEALHIDEIAAYRGTTNRSIQGQELVSSEDPIKTVDKKLSPINSFSTDFKIAHQFAGLYSNSAVLSTVVPRQRIFRVIRTMGEQEIVVIGGGHNKLLASQTRRNPETSLNDLIVYLHSIGKFEKAGDLAAGYRWVTINGMHIPVKGDAMDEHGGLRNSPENVEGLKAVRQEHASRQSGAEEPTIDNVDFATTYKASVKNFDEMEYTDNRMMAEDLLGTEPHVHPVMGETEFIEQRIKEARAIADKLRDNEDFKALQEFTEEQESRTRYGMTDPAFLPLGENVEMMRDFGIETDKAALTVHAIREAWEWSSTNAPSTILQTVVQDVFKLPRNIAMRGVDAEFVREANSLYGDPRAAQFRRGIEAYAKAQYEYTQQYAVEKGIEGLWLWRGMSGHLTEGQVTGDVRNRVVTGRPLNSYTYDRDSASLFARSDPDGHAGEIIGTYMPRERFFALTHNIEGEVIAIGGDMDPHLSLTHEQSWWTEPRESALSAKISNKFFAYSQGKKSNKLLDLLGELHKLIQ